MDTGVLIGKLLDIERALGIEDTASLRTRVVDAQDCVLRMQKQLIEDLRVRSGFSIVHEPHTYRKTA
jgi:hypothetical protein